jgi:hypothetical protein
MKYLGEKWSNLPADEKAVYDAKSKALKEANANPEEVDQENSEAAENIAVNA